MYVKVFWGSELVTLPRLQAYLRACLMARRLAEASYWLRTYPTLSVKLRKVLLDTPPILFWARTFSR
jgi:hypothetical protein